MKNDDLNFVSFLSRDSICNSKHIYVPSNLKISGSVHLSVECKGKLVISDSGIVAGNVKAENLVLEGTLRGDAYIQDHLFISSSAKVTGYISAHKLVIEEGAVCHFRASIDKAAGSRYEKASLDSDSSHPGKSKNREMKSSVVPAQPAIEQAAPKPEATNGKSEKSGYKPPAPDNRSKTADSEKPVKSVHSPTEELENDETDHFW